MLCAPKDVYVPNRAAFSSEFVPVFQTREWLGAVVSEIETEFVRADNESGTGHLKPPMALVRGSRGGKSRALVEVASEFKKRHPEACVIRVRLFISTAEHLDLWEQADLVGAICRRIGFAAWRGRIWKLA